jgi:transcriptional regulator with XRE-family HTH domain
VFGSRLRTLRKARRLTQQQLAAQVGLGQTYISLVERNLVPAPNILVVAQLAVALEAAPADLLDPTAPQSDRELVEWIYLWLILPPLERTRLLESGYSLCARPAPLAPTLHS